MTFQTEIILLPICLTGLSLRLPGFARRSAELLFCRSDPDREDFKQRMNE